MAGDTRLDKLNHAILQLETLELQADGIILHPSDWRAIQLQKTEEGGANLGAYLLGSPTTDAGIPNLWGKLLSITTAMPKGHFLVGAFQRGTAVYDRMQAVVEVSDSHSDWFTRNLLCLRAEERLALVVTNRDCLTYGAF